MASTMNNLHTKIADLNRKISCDKEIREYLIKSKKYLNQCESSKHISDALNNELQKQKEKTNYYLNMFQKKTKETNQLKKQKADLIAALNVSNAETSDKNQFLSLLKQHANNLESCNKQLQSDLNQCKKQLVKKDKALLDSKNQTTIEKRILESTGANYPNSLHGTKFNKFCGYF